MEISEKILRDCAAQNQLAQNALYEYCYKQFIRTCMRYYANHEDARFALNKGFLKILNGLPNVDWEKLNFPAWAKRIIVNSLIDDYRQKKNYQSVHSITDNEAVLDLKAENVKNEAEITMNYQEIMNLLKTIPSISAQVFTLYVIDGYSHKEISEMMQFTEGNSKWHLSTARKLLRERIVLMEKNETIHFSL